jgi:hypothetical protein
MRNKSKATSRPSGAQTTISEAERRQRILAVYEYLIRLADDADAREAQAASETAQR